MSYITHRWWFSILKLIEAKWRTYASVIITRIGPDNGLSPRRRQAIVWTNAWILSTGPLGTNFSEILIEFQSFSVRKMHLKMVAILSWPQCVNSLSPSDMCLTAMPSFVQLVAWPLSGARPKSESEVCSFCALSPTNYVVFNVTTLCVVFYGYFIGISLEWIKARTFCFADAIIVNMVGISCTFCLCTLIPCCVENEVFLNPESWLISNDIAQKEWFSIV